MSRASYLDSMTPAQRRRYERQQAITPHVRAQVLTACGMRCTYCGRVGELHRDPDGSKWNVDHIEPVARGGDHDRANLTLACAHCNRIKGAMTVPELVAHLALMAATVHAVGISG